MDDVTILAFVLLMVTIRIYIHKKKKKQIETKFEYQPAFVVLLRSLLRVTQLLSRKLRRRRASVYPWWSRTDSGYSWNGMKICVGGLNYHYNYYLSLKIIVLTIIDQWIISSHWHVWQYSAVYIPRVLGDADHRSHGSHSSSSYSWTVIVCISPLGINCSLTKVDGTDGPDILALDNYCCFSVC